MHDNNDHGPFGAPPAQPRHGIHNIQKLNQMTLDNLIRESTKEAAEKVVEAAKLTAEKCNRENSSKVDVREMMKLAKEAAASTNWETLDLIALRRAALAIIDLDSLGMGVTDTEATLIASRSPSQIRQGIRQLTQRHDQERNGIDPLTISLAADVIGSPFASSE